MGSRLESNSSAVRKRIEQHTFDNEEGEEYEPSKFGGFNDYFRRKKIKLQNRDAELRAGTQDKPAIFRNVVAHVNGYTQPSLNDLHKLIVSHGGGFMQYLDGKTTVTHIIASNLTPKKKVEFARYRIVKPAWIVDSIAAGKLLPWDAFRAVDEGVNQKLLGFDNGKVVSQINDATKGYKEQTDTSWYTTQIKGLANQLETMPIEKDAKQNATDSQIIRQEDYDILRSLSLPSSLGASSQDQSQIKQLPADEAAPAQSVTREIIRQASICHEKTNDADERPESGDKNKTAAQSATIDPAQPVTPKLDRSGSQNDKNHSSLSEELVVSIENSDKVAEMTPEEHNALLLADPKVRKSTVVNPAFLKQYYEESRLHHLSAWKAALKTKLQALAAEKSASQRSREKRAPGSRRYILHVDFDSFFAAVSLKKHPQFVDKPVVVAHGNGAGAEIASCNYPARKYGIKNGMWMKHAQKMCTSLKVLPYDFPAYEAASRDFYEAIIATGGVVQSVSVDEALVDVSAECISAGGNDGKTTNEGYISREQERADNIAIDLREQIKEKTGCEVSVGIGGNILLAKVALRRAKPAGQYHIKPEEALEFIGELTMQDLPGIAYSIGGRLAEIGVKFVKDVRQLSKERMTSVLGPKTGEKIWDYSRGIDRSEVGDQVVRKSVSAEVNWGIRFATQDQADEFIMSLAEELHKRLLTEGVKGRQLTMKIMRRAADAPLDPPKHLGHGKCDTFNKSLALGVATNDTAVIGREALSVLKGFGFTPGELRGLGIQMQKLETIKGLNEASLDSSQRRLQFRTPVVRKPALPVHDTIEDEIESPQKARDIAPAHMTPASGDPSLPSVKSHQPLNLCGTQFVMPSQVDPEVLKALPSDIRTRLKSKLPDNNVQDLDRSATRGASRSVSPGPLDNLPPSHSQIDKGTLDALPEDVRDELLRHYMRSPRKVHNQAVLPQSPRTTRTVKLPKKRTTPIKKRGRPLGSIGNKSTNPTTSTLTQSNFVANAKASSKLLGDETEQGHSDDVSEEFLSALPDDIRREVMNNARKERLQRRGGINVVQTKKKRQYPTTAMVTHQTLDLPLRPPKPYFTNQQYTELADLRKAVSEWYEAFSDEEPFEEDTLALSRYLTRVVLEERDMAKAAGVVRWLIYLIETDQYKTLQKDGWKGARKMLEQSVQDALKERGLGAIDFSR